MEMIESCIRDLPIDIQRYIYDKVFEIRKPKKVLPITLKQDIESYSLFPPIVDKYKIMFHGMHHLDWVENAIIKIMNNHNTIGIGGLYDNIHQDLKNAFPNLTDEEIRTTLMEHSHLQRLWRYMPPRKRFILYLESCDNIF
jgi:hypothetical protein